jgi:hypothetical protein
VEFKLNFLKILYKVLLLINNRISSLVIKVIKLFKGNTQPIIYKKVTIKELGLVLLKPSLGIKNKWMKMMIFIKYHLHIYNSTIMKMNKRENKHKECLSNQLLLLQILTTMIITESSNSLELFNKVKTTSNLVF